MWFQSQEGVGSTFYFTIVVPKLAPPETRFIAVKKGLKVAVTGASSVLQGFMQRFIRSCEMECLAFQHVSESLLKDLYRNVDLIFVDITNKEHERVVASLQKPDKLVLLGTPKQSELNRFKCIKKPVKQSSLIQLLNEYFYGKSQEVPISPQRYDFDFSIL